MKYKIGCNVSECAHNCIDDSTCRLDTINVCPCNSKGEHTRENKTACGMYSYAGDLNFREKSDSLQL